jgi:hypothetical protein
MKLDENNDTLSRWIAHDLAARMLAAEKMKGAEKKVFEGDLQNTILKLWDHRSSMTERLRPLKDYEPILRTLESLDPSKKSPFYYQAFTDLIGRERTTAVTRKWLETAAALDLMARALIRFALMEATASVPRKAKEWLNLATRVMDRDDGDIRAIYILSNLDAMMKVQEKADPKAAERERIEELRNKLKRLTKIAENYLAVLDERIAALK